MHGNRTDVTIAIGLYLNILCGLIADLLRCRCNALLLALGDLLLVWEVQSIDTGVLHRHRSVAGYQLVYPDHALCGDSRLGQVDPHQRVFEAQGDEKLFQSARETMVKLHVLGEIEAFNEGVLENT